MKLKKLLVKVLAGALLVSAVGAGYISSSAADDWEGLNISFEGNYWTENGTDKNAAAGDVRHVSGFRFDSWGEVAAWGEDIMDDTNHVMSLPNTWASGGIYFKDGAATTVSLKANEEYELSMDILGGLSTVWVGEAGPVPGVDGDGNPQDKYNVALQAEVLEAVVTMADETAISDFFAAPYDDANGGFGQTSTSIMSPYDWSNMRIKFKVPVDASLMIGIATANSGWGLDGDGRTYLDNIIIKPAGAPDPAPFEIAYEAGENTDAPTEIIDESVEPTDGGDATAEPTAAATTAAATDAATATQAPTATASDLPTTTATTDPGTIVTKPKSVKLNKKKVTLKVKKSVKLKATLKPKNISAGWKKLTWKSNKPKVAKVNKKGKVTAVKKGTAKITVKTKNKKSAKCTVKVK